MLNRFLPKPVSLPVRGEQIRLLYHQGVPILLLGIVTGIIMFLTFWKVVDHVLLSLWLGVHVVVSLVRVATTLKFNRGNITGQPALERWARAYVAGTFISGLVWGAFSLFFDPAWPMVNQVMIFMLYTGITAGAFNTNSSFFIAFPMFFLPPTLALMYVMLHQSVEGAFVLASLFVIYIVLMYVSALKFHDRLADSLEVRFENQRLAEQLAQSNQKLTVLADMDELTGIANRRSMDRYLKSEWNRHCRAGKPLSMLFIDLDFFKQYNDTYGHEGGDRCLMQIAGVLRSHSQRSNDMAARFGGEEFAVILPETSGDDALNIAETIRADLEKLQIPHDSSAVAGHVTLSIGVATMIPSHPDGQDAIRLAADRALYQAKKQGRNRVVRAEVPESRTLAYTA